MVYSLSEIWHSWARLLLLFCASRRLPWNIFASGKYSFHDSAQAWKPGLISCKLSDHGILFWYPQKQGPYPCDYYLYSLHRQLPALTPFLGIIRWASQVAMVKNLPVNTGDPGSIFGLERSPGEGNGNLLQYSCLDNPMGRRVWQPTVHSVTKESGMT